MSAIAGAASMRAIREAVTEAVSAIRARDGEQFEIARHRLASLDQERLRLVQGSMVRELLEELHPSGLSGADAQQVLERCSQAAGSWLPAADAMIMVTVLMGALGAQDPDQAAPTDRSEIAAHGCLLIEDLLTARGEASGGLERYLSGAFAEIERAETMELP